MLLSFLLLDAAMHFCNFGGSLNFKVLMFYFEWSQAAEHFSKEVTNKLNKKTNVL